MIVTPTLPELIGEIVQLDLFLEFPNPFLSLSGIVLYAVDSGIGIRFTGRPLEQQSTLKRYLEALRERPSSDRNCAENEVDDTTFLYRSLAEPSRLS
jgi:hypothetical protein